MNLDDRILETENKIKELCKNINHYSVDVTKENNLVMLRTYSQELHETLCVLRYLRQMKNENQIS